MGASGAELRAGAPAWQRWLVLGLRVALAALFVVAGLAKLRDPARFALEIGNYRLAAGLAPALAAFLPAAEIVGGAGVLLLSRPWRRAAALLLGVLMLAFTFAVSSALARGVNIDCGCFGGGEGPITALTLARNLVLLAACAALVRLER